MSASLEASLRLEIAQYQAALAKAKGDAVKFKDGLKREGNGLGPAFLGPLKGQLSGLLPAMSAAAVVTGLHSIVSAADDLADAATKLDATPMALQRVQAAATILGGTDLDTVSSALTRLRRQLIDDPGSALAKGLEQVGIYAADFLRLDADEQIMQLADAYTKAQQSGVALPLLNEAFGKSFKELIPLLSQGSEGIKAFYNETIVASDTTIARLAAANDRIDGFITGVKNWATEAAGAVLGLGEAVWTGGKSLEEGQAKADEAAMKALQAREAQAQEAMKKKTEADAKAATKAAGLDKKGGSTGSGTAGGDPFAATISAQEKLDAAKRRMAEEEMTHEEKIADLRKRLNEDPMADPFGSNDPAAAIESEMRKVEIQRELNKLLRDEAEERARIAEEGQTMLDKDMEKEDSQNAAKKSLAEELQMAQAKASGNSALVAQMERELRIRAKAKEIQDSTGANAEQSRAAASTLVGFEDAAAAEKTSVSGKQGIRRRMMGGGVDDFNRLQSGGFGAGALSKETGSLTDRARRNADRADSKGDNLTTLEGINKAQLDCLKILAG